MKFWINLSYFNKFGFSRQISYKFQISNFMEIRPVGVALIDEDIRTDGLGEAEDSHDGGNMGFLRLCEHA